MEIDHDGNGIAGAKRNLLDEFSEEDGTMVNPVGGNLAVTETLPPPVGAETYEGDATKTNKPKRSKKDGADSSSIGSASSREELVRSQ
jgi:hypothetical protein